MYSILYSPDSLKKLKKLSKEIQKRILSVLERCRIRPHHFVKRIVDSPYFRLRVGDYRVIMDIEDDKLVIFSIELGHRKKIYKK